MIISVTAIQHPASNRGIGYRDHIIPGPREDGQQTAFEGDVVVVSRETEHASPTQLSGTWRGANNTVIQNVSKRRKTCASKGGANGGRVCRTLGRAANILNDLSGKR